MFLSFDLYGTVVDSSMNLILATSPKLNYGMLNGVFLLMALNGIEYGCWRVV